MRPLRTLVVFALASVSAFPEVIIFDELPAGTYIDGRRIKGVLFSFTPTFTPDDLVAPWGDQAQIFDHDIGSFSGNWLLLTGECSACPQLAVLTMEFLDMHPWSLSFQYAVPYPNGSGNASAGKLELFDVGGQSLGKFVLLAVFNNTTHNSEGNFSFSGSTISRAVLTVANLVSLDTTPAIDTIAFAAPEPSTLLQVLLALSAVGIRRVIPCRIRLRPQDRLPLVRSTQSRRAISIARR